LIFEFERLSSALAAIAERSHELNGHRVNVKEARRHPIESIAVQEEKSMVNLKECRKSTIFSKSFLATDADEDIRNYFMRFGKVIGFRRGRRNNNNLAWIEFASPASCSVAVEEQEHILHSRKIVVDYHNSNVGKGNRANGGYLSGTSEQGKRRENRKRTGSGKLPESKRSRIEAEPMYSFFLKRFEPPSTK